MRFATFGRVIPSAARNSWMRRLTFGLAATPDGGATGAGTVRVRAGAGVVGWDNAGRDGGRAAVLRRFAIDGAPSED